jgi:hypothetical protein
MCSARYLKQPRFLNNLNRYQFATNNEILIRNDLNERVGRSLQSR